MKKRIYSIDVLKLVFAYIIAFFHFGTTIAPGPTVAVQVFFIISGFFWERNSTPAPLPTAGSPTAHGTIRWIM